MRTCVCVCVCVKVVSMCEGCVDGESVVNGEVAFLSPKEFLANRCKIVS